MDRNGREKGRKSEWEQKRGGEFQETRHHTRHYAILENETVPQSRGDVKNNKRQERPAKG